MEMTEQLGSSVPTVPNAHGGAVSGYPKIASLMGSHPEMLMVRLFRALNARNLLYLQAELHHIEDQLLKCEQVDTESDDPEVRFYSQDWWSLNNSKGNEHHEQWLLVQKMKEKLREYGK